MLGEPISGVVTHEFGHAINLAHSQTNGYYSRNRPNPDFGLPAGHEQAGPDQCGDVVPEYPTAAQIETMYPMINPFPCRSSYNSPQMATVNVADDKAALSSIYPAANYGATTGTLKGRVVAKDGTSQLTGINVIARRGRARRSTRRRASRGDLTQGLLGPDGSVHDDGARPGRELPRCTSTRSATAASARPRRSCSGLRNTGTIGESADATQDDACAVLADHARGRRNARRSRSR